MSILIVVVCALAGYLVGSIPFGYLIVRAVKGVDLRSVGSGRTGGTNAYRAAGLPAGIATAILDTIKGVVCVLIIRALGLGDATQGWAEAMAGIGVVLGHNASIFLNFAGGAGGATAVGTSLVYLPAAGLAALVVGVFFLVIVGYPFMASILAALTAAIGLTLAAVAGAVPASYAAFGWGIVGIICYALRPNIVRFAKGQEKRVGLLARKPGRIVDNVSNVDNVDNVRR
jgi:glycerol-3-phosphate acyltransferase PlsY